jgi:hypothetical protein
MSDESAILSGAEEEELVRELAQKALQVAAPEELVLFDESADEYFADPEGTLRSSARDEPVGFGVELALLTPYLLAVIKPVIQLLAGMVSDSVKAEGQPAVSRLVRRLVRGTQKDAPPGSEAGGGEDPPTLTSTQIGLVRDVAFERARTVGLPDDRAALLADAIAGGVTTRSVP